MLAWVARRAGTSYLGAAILLLRVSALGAFHEIVMSLRMQKIFRELEDPNLLIESAPERLPYRNEAEIRRLFERLAIAFRIRAFPPCWLVEITASKYGDGR
jgi:hypothetical protein